MGVSGSVSRATGPVRSRAKVEPARLVLRGVKAGPSWHQMRNL